MSTFQGAGQWVDGAATQRWKDTSLQTWAGITGTFDVAALDFLVKPVDPDRLETAINRLRERLVQQQPAAGVTTRPPTRILLKSMMSSVMVSVNTITLLQAEADFTRVHVDTDQTYLAGGLLGKFEADLPSPPFCRLSRSLIVNLEQIHAVEWQSGGRSIVRFSAAGRGSLTDYCGAIPEDSSGVSAPGSNLASLKAAQRAKAVLALPERLKLAGSLHLAVSELLLLVPQLLLLVVHLRAADLARAQLHAQLSLLLAFHSIVVICLG